VKFEGSKNCRYVDAFYGTQKFIAMN